MEDLVQEKKRKSVKKNYIYNLFYQAFSLIVPLLVTPYVSRVLLPEGNGAYSFSFSLITYFTIFASLGFGIYAQREIAKHQGDQHKQTILFWEMNIARIFPVLVSLIVNICLCCFNVYESYTMLMWVLNINILAVCFDIAFFFQGNEEFGKLVLRNAIIKLLSTIAIFIFVKNEKDLLIYTLINSVMVIVSNLIMWLTLPKLLCRVSIKELRPLTHMKGSLRLFIPAIATTVYTVLDKTLIGFLIQDTYTVIEDGVEIVKRYADLENGYYEQSEKIVKMAMTIITCIGTVMIPRNSHEIASGNTEKVKENIYLSARIVWLIAIPLSLGFVAIANNFVPWFYGDGYQPCVNIISILSFLIIIIGFSNVFGIQYLLPYGKDNKYTIAIVVGAITNLIFNLIFIPLWWSMGAAIASLIGEFMVTLVMMLMIRKEISFKKIILSSWRYCLSGLIMFGITYYVGTLFPSSIGYTICLIVIGMAIYGLCLLIFRDSLILGTIKKVTCKFKKEK